MKRRGRLRDVGGWTPVVDVVVADVGETAALVYGRVWRYCQMRDGVCRASVERMAGEVGRSVKTVRRCLKLLCRRGYLRDRTPGRRYAPHEYADAGKVLVFGLVEVQRGAGEGTREVGHSDHLGWSQRRQRLVTVTTKDTMKTRVKIPPPESAGELESTDAADGGVGLHTQALGVLVSFGVNPPVARELAGRCSLGDIEGWVRYARRAQGLRNPVGLVVARLKAGEPAPARESDEPASCRGMPLLYE